MAGMVRGKKNLPAGGTGPTGKTQSSGKVSDRPTPKKK